MLKVRLLNSHKKRAKGVNRPSLLSLFITHAVCEYYVFSGDCASLNCPPILQRFVI